MENLERYTRIEDDNKKAVTLLNYAETEKRMYEMEKEGKHQDENGDFSEEYKALIEHRTQLEKH